MNGNGMSGNGSNGNGYLHRAAPNKDRPRSYNGDMMAVGNNGENRVMPWLQENPHVLGVADLRSLKQMREADVDCSLSLGNGIVTLAEIKSDYHLGKSGNVLFEVLRINHTAADDHAVTLGWSARSPAVWLLYYAPQVDCIYQCRMAALRRVCQLYVEANRPKIRFSVIPTDAIKTTVNILIPESYCQDIFTIHPLSGPRVSMYAQEILEGRDHDFGS